MLIPQYVEGVEVRLGTPEKQIPELRLAIGIEANDFAVENAPATPEVKSEPFAQIRERLKTVSVAGDQAHGASVGPQYGSETVPLDLEQPIRRREGLWPAAEGNRLEVREGQMAL